VPAEAFSSTIADVPFLNRLRRARVLIVRHVSTQIREVFLATPKIVFCVGPCGQPGLRAAPKTPPAKRHADQDACPPL